MRWQRVVYRVATEDNGSGLLMSTAIILATYLIGIADVGIKIEPRLDLMLIALLCYIWYLVGVLTYVNFHRVCKVHNVDVIK